MRDSPLAIIVNLEYDPTAAFRNQVVHFDFRKLDVFSFGEEQNCLVGSVDLLYRNSWNEVRTLHFNGEQAMIEALKTILGKMHPRMPRRRIASRSSAIASICAV